MLCTIPHGVRCVEAALRRVASHVIKTQRHAAASHRSVCHNMEWHGNMLRHGLVTQSYRITSYCIALHRTPRTAPSHNRTATRHTANSPLPPFLQADHAKHYNLVSAPRHVTPRTIKPKPKKARSKLEHRGQHATRSVVGALTKPCNESR